MMGRVVRALVAAWGFGAACCSAVKLAATASPADTSMVLIAGRAKCGTSHLHRMLSAHPDVFALPKEICPSKVGETEEQFAELLTFAAEQAREGGSWRALNGVELFGRCVQKFGEARSATCDWLFNKTQPGGSEHHTAVLQACIQPKIVSKLQTVAPVAGARALFLMRDPADLAWSAYNFWQGEMDAPHTRADPEHSDWAGPGAWTQKSNYRSPEHFHELVLSRGNLSGSVGDWRDYVGVQDMDRLQSSFGINKVLFVRSEDLKDKDAVRKITDFVGLDADRIPDEVILGATNSQGTLDTRGPSKPESTRELGVYEISGYRPMLCETRKIIYEETRSACEELQMRFGLSYPACLGKEKLEC